MDVGNPSNFVRLMDLYNNDFDAVSADIIGYAFTHEETRSAMRHVLASTDYVMDPHGAVGYLGLKKYLLEKDIDAAGIFLETAHPAKFKEVVDVTLNRSIDIPAPLQKFMAQSKKSVPMKKEFEDFKSYLKGNL